MPRSDYCAQLDVELDVESVDSPSVNGRELCHNRVHNPADLCHAVQRMPHSLIFLADIKEGTELEAKVYFQMQVGPIMH